jgi:hypothetical protein
MNKFIFALGFFALMLSCNKTEAPNPVNPTPIAPVVVNPPNQTITLKNYLLPSYDLQQSDVNIDIMRLRVSQEGINSGWNILAVSFLDINGDGNDDIYYNSSFGQNVRTRGKIFIFKNGDYILDSTYTTTSLIHPRKSIVGDFNNDKMPDIFVAAHGDDRPPFAGEYTQMLLSNSNKKYNLVEFKERESFYHGACSGDIDKDGDLDIFVLGKPDSYFLINDGKGNFTYALTKIDKNTLIDQYTCELVDIDKDGNLDLIMGGHEFMNDNTTRIYWGDASGKYFNKTDLPAVVNLGTITDFDIYDLNNDGKNEVIVTRTGGRPNDFNEYFYSGWYIQVLSISDRKPMDETLAFIEGNTYAQSIRNNQDWIAWLRFNDYDKNGKMDLYSTKCTNLPMVRWELQNKKLVRIQ